MTPETTEKRTLVRVIARGRPGDLNSHLPYLITDPDTKKLIPLKPGGPGVEISLPELQLKHMRMDTNLVVQEVVSNEPQPVVTPIPEAAELEEPKDTTGLESTPSQRKRSGR